MHIYIYPINLILSLLCDDRKEARHANVTFLRDIKYTVCVPDRGATLVGSINWVIMQMMMMTIDDDDSDTRNYCMHTFLFYDK